MNMETNQAMRKAISACFINSVTRKGDVELDGETGEAVGSGNDRRLAMLAAISDNSERLREEELEEIQDDDTTVPFKAPPVSDEEAVVEEPKVEEKTEAAVEQTAVPKMKVLGKEVELTEAFIAHAQKIAAADVYLSEAQQLRAEAIKNKQALPAKADAAEEAFTEDELALVRAIQMGGEEEAAAALRKLVAKPAPVIDKADVAKQIDEKLAFNEAYSKFVSEYQDVVNDPVLFKLAQDRDDVLRAKGDSRPFYDRFKECGDAVRTWKQELIKQSGVGQTQEQTKEQRKAAAPSVPKQATAKHNSQAAEEKEPTPQETIAAMAKARGGPQWMRSATR